MPIKTILVAVSPGDNRLDRLAVALAFARRSGARLELIYLTAPPGMPPEITGRGASAAFLAEAVAINAERAPAVRDELTGLCRGAGVDCGWELADGPPNEVLAERSWAADLLVVHRHYADTADTDGDWLHSTDELLIHAACPALILPIGPAVRAAGRRVLVAWKDTLSAARAVHAALPVLAAAEAVTLFACGERPPGIDRLAAHLARHGVPAAVEIESDADGIAPAILARTASSGADTLVMGAFGRHRWQERLLGGITRDVFDNVAVPILTAH